MEQPVCQLFNDYRGRHLGATHISSTSFIKLSESSTCVSGLYYKSFTIVIYDHNDSTIVEPIL
jgi:hypothetical protein